MAALGKTHALRLGTGVKRDFVAAARAYADLCRGGCGDAEACREYVHLAGFSRGAVLSRADLDIGVRLCTRGDAVACHFAQLTGMLPVSAAPSPLEAACEQNDRQACALRAAFDFEGTRLGIPYEGQHVAEPPRLGQRATLQACIHGDGRACESLMSSHLSGCRRGMKAADACVEKDARAYEAATHDTGKPLRDAWAKTKELCAAGDVDACKQVPGKQITNEVLCAAGDWPSCSSSVPVQAKRACDAGYLELCEPRGEHASGGMRLLTLQDQCAKGDQKICADVARETAVAACP